MNFFEYQDKARRNTTLLVALFAAAVLALIAITTVFFAFISRASGSAGPESSLTGMLAALGWDTVAGIAIAITAVIALASFYRLHQLAAGGRAVAESLGGRKINVAPRDLAEQRALNVVEEMALASGTPVPEVYVLDDDAINAFAAGYQPSDAVIGLTRGSIEQLSRDELQGVVAHEFSHIFNGDMRLNIRIVGLLHGILIIGLIGSWLLRGGYWGSGRDSRGRAALFGVGVGLVAIGYTGTFFGNLIKSAVSRQREYLADASAVQFTRSNQGIAGALKKIGSRQQGSHLRAVNASEFSHMYFASGMKHSFLGLFATHPPLAERIGRLDPQWKGWDYPATETTGDSHSEQISGIHSANIQPAAAAAGHPSPDSAPGSQYRARLGRVLTAVDNNVAQPSAAQVTLGSVLLAQIPADLKAAAHDPFAARALVYGLLMAPSQFTLQRAVLEKSAHPAVLREFDRLQPSLAPLPATSRLPLLDLCVPALKALAPQQYQIFKRNLIKLLRADGRVEIWEWALYRVLIHGLEANPDQQRKTTAGSRDSARTDAQRFLLAAMAHAGNTDYLSAKRAYEAGLKTLAQTPVPLPAAGDINLQRLDKALAIARDTAPLKKPVLLKALATTLAHDGEIRAQEIELLRAIADCLDCPMPPLVDIPASTLQHDERSICAAATS
ncbi:M48 family metallopeptidase [Microbulbifer harenosus]|uniref:Zn-dependent protease with chaperone function n=1 Tax=Microbulbifer harenosus TaxID=2576840 RepID=A0ABY2UGW1_9GAMM|nr:M48 family metallopeptidase [Microbulbifer harenosus]TLM76909.1 Zn-dependent protease with chaperone function [Microbulbifer harenosus]